jgi:hypothetical protein
MMLTVQSVQSDVAGPYRPYRSDVAESGWLAWSNQMSTRGSFVDQ